MLRSSLNSISLGAGIDAPNTKSDETPSSNSVCEVFAAVLWFVTGIATLLRLSKTWDPYDG